MGFLDRQARTGDLRKAPHFKLFGAEALWVRKAILTWYANFEAASPPHTFDEFVAEIELKLAALKAIPFKETALAKNLQKGNIAFAPAYLGIEAEERHELKNILKAAAKAFYEITWDRNPEPSVPGGSPPSVLDLRPYKAKVFPYTKLSYQPIGGECISRDDIAKNVATLVKRFRMPIVIEFQGNELEVDDRDDAKGIYAKLSAQNMFEPRGGLDAEPWDHLPHV